MVGWAHVRNLKVMSAAPDSEPWTWLCQNRNTRMMLRVTSHHLLCLLPRSQQLTHACLDASTWESSLQIKNCDRSCGFVITAQDPACMRKTLSSSDGGNGKHKGSLVCCAAGQISNELHLPNHFEMRKQWGEVLFLQVE